MRLNQFVGLADSDCSALEGPSLPRGAIRLDTSIGNFDSDSLTVVESKVDKDAAAIVWETPDKALRIDSHWTCDDVTGVWRRKDTLRNASSKGITVTCALARFVLAPGQYEVYSQSSKWCRENQGAWQPLQHGALVVHSEAGQTCRGASPYICVSETRQKTGMAFHILPCGNWTIRVDTNTAKLGAQPFLIVELGMDDRSLRLNLPPNQTLELPEILFYPLIDNDPALTAPALHSYVAKNLLPPVRRITPVVYNTWFFMNEWFTVDALRRQLIAAKNIGCEVFVVDAGWYGTGSGGWSEQVGDWREKIGGGFNGAMAAFAAEVRSAGLGFGLWMEPERLGGAVPILKQHPDWFITTDGGKFYYPNLDKPECYAYTLSEMSRLVDTYELVWMKIDFNFERGADPSGAQYYTYYAAWYRLMDEVRAKYPGVFFEACSSGGLRLDLNTLSHCNGHFLSDTVAPLDVLRIGQGAALRIPPGRITRWAVLGAPKTAAGLRLRGNRGQDGLIAPAGATWERTVPANVDLAACAALPGIFGVSGDIAGLPTAAQERLRYYVTFFKKWRHLITNSAANLLTPPRAIEDGKGWAALQMQGLPRWNNNVTLLFVYRLDDPASKMSVRMRDLDPALNYSVSTDNNLLAQRTGKQLMDEGLTVDVAIRNSARVLVVTPSPSISGSGATNRK